MTLMRAVRVCTLLLLALGFTVAARADDHPVLPQIDRDVAAKHFQEGQAAYASERWQAALEEFEKAHKVHPVPELDYNIALCLDRLERWAEAAAAYRRFVNGTHNQDPAVSKRIDELEARVAAIPVAPLAPKSHRELAAPLALASIALVATVAGAALLGAAHHELDTQQVGCAPSCDFQKIGYSIGAGYALLATAGVALVVDVPFWVIALRKPPSERSSERRR
jgi:tetratricopeptide (TPR) repeat protein